MQLQVDFKIAMTFLQLLKIGIIDHKKFCVKNTKKIILINMIYKYFID